MLISGHVKSNTETIFHDKSSFLTLKTSLWTLPSTEVHAWLASVDDVPDVLLTVSEIAYLKTITLPSIARRFVSTRKWLRYLLSGYLGCSPEEINIEKTPRGKPFVLEFPGISFSVTHAENMIAIAVSRQPLGIDLELVRPLNFFPIASRFFAAQELHFLKTGNEQYDRECFFRLWTAKEAALKADGSGIAHGLKNSVAQIKDGQVVSMDLKNQQWFITPWSLKHQADELLDEGSRFSGAIATSVLPAVIHWYDVASSVNNNA